MDQERERIQEDLRGLVDGDVRCDDLFTQLYASDASIYQINPLGVVRPRHTGDVVACVNYASEQGLGLHPRGAGTGVAGESLGPGLVIDFSYYMRRIMHVDDDYVTCLPGVVLGRLNRFLEPRQKLFGPDPATRTVSTVGGVVGKNGSGSHWLRYGSVRDKTESLQVVLSNGQVIELSKHAPESPGLPPSADLAGHLATRVAEVLDREQAAIQKYSPQVDVATFGYQVRNVVNNGRVDLAKMLVGSEGTLGLVTEAKFKLDPLPKAVGVVLLFFDRLDAAARAALEITPLGVSSCDLMDRRLLSLARESDPRFEALIPTRAEALLLVEQDGEDIGQVRDELQKVVTRTQRRKRLAFDARIALEPEEVELFWGLAERVVPSLYQLRGSIRPLPFVEDVAVPPAKLPEFLTFLQNLWKEQEVTASLYAHAGHGQLHVRPFMDLSDPDNGQKMQDLATALYDQAFEIGGTIGSEHGLGFSRPWYVQRHCQSMYHVFRQVKRIFDPLNLLNPGKVTSDAPQPVAKHIRPVAIEIQDEAVTLPSLPIAEWQNQDVTQAARQCNGCARCRTQLPDQRMCPIFRYAPREEATPRAKANMMRAVMTGQLEVDTFATEEFKSLADLCVHCHQCRLECPASVDIPRLMVEAKAQYVATNGMRIRDWILVRPHVIAGWAAIIAPLVNWAIRNRQMRWVIEKFTGIAQGRKLPRVASNTFLRRAHRRRLTRSTREARPKVVLFVDVYANWFDVELADALVSVLEHNGVSIYAPTNQLPSGMPLIAAGVVESAKKVAIENVRMLADAVRQGYHIITPEPAAALALTHEYLHLVDDEDARLVADNTSEACSYLWNLHVQGRLELDFRPINSTIGYHMPCHLKTLASVSPGLQLLRLIPGLAVQELEKGCSGMAGMYGMKQTQYRSSLRAGWGLISALRAPGLQAGTTECSCCKIQMEQGTSKPTVHPLKMLAMSYGLLSQQSLQARGEDLMVT